jgi:hypothetical protein
MNCSAVARFRVMAPSLLYSAATPITCPSLSVQRETWCPDSPRPQLKARRQNSAGWLGWAVHVVGAAGARCIDERRCRVGVNTDGVSK